MKVYLYYLIHKPIIDILKSRRLIDWIGVPVSEIDDVCFYGYTDDKKVAKKFESTRNMSIFKKITKNMDEDEYKALEDKASSFAKISISDIPYPFSDDLLLFEDPIRCKIPLTSSEYWYGVENYKECIMETLMSLPKVPSTSIFREDIHQLLRDMDYNDSVINTSDVNECIRTCEVLHPLASYSCYYAWNNIIGILTYLYENIFNHAAIFEVIVNGSK